ncbi:hypothetical protein Anas_02330 [Armadillidium nasatum]|uniref:Uncharacterized protein n=1 Tax=Armadillidium nasatum TaxID=96803 RepID=A0A5N5THZ1_9CRUS|nr:hypothetical protein Anas_02330 [Armadillidium nasatum]
MRGIMVPLVVREQRKFVLRMATSLLGTAFLSLVILC